ncbi:hypothetical protein KIPB_002568 [Kipferlia bialata]|uniref:Uncharacterized protein n=1 Tax=Kipferlia bialata TaxID=797122 RepID=A0A391NK51_9EUKA|nr:hypothetical protein KIPB_002568 [Kipferlia bialata]|eukprot:g2568.t1
MDIPTRVVIHDSSRTCPIPLDTPVGMLRYLVEPGHIGPLTLSASFVSDTPDIGEDRERERKGILADTVYPSLSPIVLARIPGMEVDPETAILGSYPGRGTTTPLVSVLSQCKSALLQIGRGRVEQVVSLGSVPQGRGCGVSTRGGIHTLLSILPTTGVEGEEETPLATAYVVGMVEGRPAWKRVGLDMTQPVTALLSECRAHVEKESLSACILMGRDSDTGSLIVGVGRGDSYSHLLYLDTSNPTPTLSVYCKLSSPVKASDVSALSCCGSVATLSPKETSPSISVCLGNGAVHASKVEGTGHRACSVGTVSYMPLAPEERVGEREKNGVGLQVSVRDSLCVPLPLVAVSYAVVGTSLIYTDTDSSLKLVDLSPLLECSLLPVVTETDVLPSNGPLPWVNDGTSSPPFQPTLTCALDNRLVAVSLVQGSLDVVGLAEFDYATCEWSVTCTPDPGAATLPLISKDTVVVGDCMYATYQGRLLSVPLSVESDSATLHLISLTGQPLYCKDSQFIVLPTSTGMRLQRVLPEVSLAAYSLVTTTGDRQAIGECYGSRCVTGIVASEDGCYSVRGCVWREMEGKNEEQEVATNSETVVHSLDSIVPLALSPTAKHVNVERVNVGDALSRQSVEGWEFTKCTFTNLSFATLSKCRFIECDLNHCDIQGTSLHNCVFTQCDMSVITVTTGASLLNVTLKECDTTHMRLKGCSLSGDNVGLPLVDKTNRDLTSEDFDGHDVTIWDMTGSRVCGMDLRGVEGLTVEHIGSLTSINQCNMSGLSIGGLDLSDTDATGSDFSSCDLTTCVVTGATLTECDFSNSKLVSVKGLTLEQLGSVSSLMGAVISEVDMHGWDMQHVDLRGVDLSGCDMRGSKVRDTLVEGTTLPMGDQAPTMTPPPKAWFEVAQGVTETVTTTSLPHQGTYNNPVTLMLPSVESTWRLTATSSTGQGMVVSSTTPGSGEGPFWPHSGDATVTRSGTTITISGPRCTTSHPCVEGQEAHVTLYVYAYPNYQGSLTIASQ